MKEPLDAESWKAKDGDNIPNFFVRPFLGFAFIYMGIVTIFFLWKFFPSPFEKNILYILWIKPALFLLLGSFFMFANTSNKKGAIVGSLALYFIATLILIYSLKTSPL